MAGGGKTFFGLVRGTSTANDVVVGQWGNAGRTLDGLFVLHAALSDGLSTVPDTHNGPAILVRSDGKILACYSGHGATTVRSRISTNAHDVTAFAVAVTSTVTPTSTYQQLGEIISTGKIYNRFRGYVGGNAGLYQRHSTDGGATWSTPFEMIRMTGNLYSQMAFDGTGRIDHVTTNRAPDAAGGFGLYHWYTDSTGMHHRSDGTNIGTDPSSPWTIADVTAVFADGSDRYPYGLGYTANGRPVIAWTSKQANPVVIGESRWSGSAWAHRTITTSDPIFTTALSVGGGVHDAGDSLHYYTGKLIGGPLDSGGSMAIYEFVSADDGATWTTGTQLSSTTDRPNSPMPVVSRNSELVVMWPYGDHADSDADPYSLGYAGARA